MNSITALFFAVRCTQQFGRNDLGNCRRRSAYCMETLIHIRKIWQRQRWKQWAEKSRAILHLVSSDFHLSGPMKVHLWWQKFQIDDEFRHGILNWPGIQNNTCYAAGISSLPAQLKICFRVKVEYLDKEWELSDSGLYTIFVKSLGQPWTTLVWLPSRYLIDNDNDNLFNVHNCSTGTIGQLS
jgi:hypothetical protein